MFDEAILLFIVKLKRKTNPDLLSFGVYPNSDVIADWLSRGDDDAAAHFAPVPNERLVVDGARLRHPVLERT